MKTIDNLPDHWRLGCSNAYRWVNCPGSKYAVDEREPGFMATVGTLGHKVVESILRCAPIELSPSDRELIDTLDPDQLDWFKQAIRFCVVEARRIMDELGTAQRSFEDKIASTSIADHGGTMDVLLYCPDSRRLVVLDFKFGRGRVEAESNSQLMCYVNLARQKHKDAETFEGVIIQPTHGTVDRQTFTKADLTRFAEKAAKAADPQNLDRHGDPEWCEYCPLLATCDAAAKMTISAVEDFGTVAEFLNGVPDEPTAEDGERLERIALMHNIAKKAFAAASDVLKSWHDQQKIAMRYHRITPAVYRSWLPSAGEKLAAIHGDDVVKTSLRSPNELQTFLKMKKKEFDKTYEGMLSFSERRTLRAGVKPEPSDLLWDRELFQDETLT